MKITRGRIHFDIRSRLDGTIFTIEIGNDEKLLANSKMLDLFPDHALDHFRVAVALREMANELDRQLV